MFDAWDVRLVEEVETWFLSLPKDAAARVADAIDQLSERGPSLGRPLVDTLKYGNVHNLKELRTGSVRILFVFDPRSRAVLLVAGDKRGRWQQWYRESIPIAEQRYARWLAGGYGDAEEER